VGTVSRRAGRFTLCVVCGCGAGHQRSAVSNWEVRSTGDCVERASSRQHNCLPLDNAAQRGTAGGTGNDMLGDSVLALPCFICAPLGAKSLATAVHSDVGGLVCPLAYKQQSASAILSMRTLAN
jgi:hypothetical protein